MDILPDIITLLQHLTTLNNNIDLYRPPCCPYCKKHDLRVHGYYYRKPDRHDGRNYLLKLNNTGPLQKGDISFIVEDNTIIARIHDKDNFVIPKTEPIYKIIVEANKRNKINGFDPKEMQQLPQSKVLCNYIGYGKTKTLNPIPIPRFICKYCKRTASVLPECIAPRRWYMWHVQQAVISQMFVNGNLRSISKSHFIGLSTCRRWWDSLEYKYPAHTSVLYCYYPELGKCADCRSFWLAYFQKLPLSKAMLTCHLDKIVVP